MLLSWKNVALIFLATTPSLAILKSESESKLPDEEAVRQENGIYEDETDYLEKSLNKFENGGRKFYLVGKSPSFLHTAKEFFSGNQSFFEGTKIHDRGNRFRNVNEKEDRHPNIKWIEYPIIYLDFSNVKDFRTFEEFDNGYKEKLRAVSRYYDLRRKCEQEEEIEWLSLLASCLESEFQLPVIVLINQYDVPIDYAAATGNTGLKSEVIVFLNNLFDGPLRVCHEIELLFVTVASKKRDSIARRYEKRGIPLRDFATEMEYKVSLESST